MMMIPEAWQGHESMSETKRAFYEYHSCLMEPWMARRRSRSPTACRSVRCSTVTAFGLHATSSPRTASSSWRRKSEFSTFRRIGSRPRAGCSPAACFLVDTSLGRIVGDDEIKESMAARKPYRQWLDRNLVKLADLPGATSLPEPLDKATLLEQQQAFGYTIEDLRMLMAPMAINGQEAVGSMGTDTPPAVLSDRPQLVFAYFKQLFAQVTNRRSIRCARSSSCRSRRRSAPSRISSTRRRFTVASSR